MQTVISNKVTESIKIIKLSYFIVYLEKFDYNWSYLKKDRE